MHKYYVGYRVKWGDKWLSHYIPLPFTPNMYEKADELRPMLLDHCTQRIMRLVMNDPQFGFRLSSPYTKDDIEKWVDPDHYNLQEYCHLGEWSVTDPTLP